MAVLTWNDNTFWFFVPSGVGWPVDMIQGLVKGLKVPTASLLSAQRSVSYHQFGPIRSAKIDAGTHARDLISVHQGKNIEQEEKGCPN